MNFMSKAATFVGAMTLAVSSFAGIKAESCPNVDAIKAQGISVVLPIDFDFYIGMEASDYGTDLPWAFLIGPIQSEDADDALNQANEDLSYITGAPLPEEDDGLILCEYNTGRDDLLAFAVYSDDFVSTAKVKHLFHK